MGKQTDVLSESIKPRYWLLLYRRSNIEFLYYGTPGEIHNSLLARMFIVKTGIPGERPTPLPELVDGREYWIITSKTATDNPETAPYFLTLNVPVREDEPFGPTPYLECNGPASPDGGLGGQCNWVLPGEFGLHGVNGDMSRLSKENPGSSGCIRHADEDIIFLYNLLDPEKEEIRYYIKDI